MKKLLLSLIALGVAFAAVACDQTTTATTAPSTQTSTGTTTTRRTATTTIDSFWDEDANGIPDWQEETITLKYASWQHTSLDVVTIESLMVQAFTEKYPNITVEMQIIGSGEEWDANMMIASESGTLPDVFLINRLKNSLPYNIVADITDYYENDPDTDFIFPSVADLGTYKGVRYAVPTFIYPQVWIVNKDILDAAGVAFPGYDWTYEQAEAIAAATTNENTHVIGMYGCEFYTRELPKILKVEAATNEGELAAARSWYAYTYDGSGFHFDDPVFLSAMTKLTDALTGGWCTQSLDAETLEAWYLDPAYTPQYNGKVALWREATWSVKNHFAEMLFDWDVYPGPDGTMGGNTDIAGISTTCDHPAAAYQLLKWMSYSEEGLLTRFQLFEDYSEQVTISANNYGYPVVDYGIDGYGVNQVWEAIPYGITAPGFESPEFMEALRNGAYWVNKETIGWDEADAIGYAYIYQVMAGETTFAAIQETFQTEAMQAMNAARAALDALIAEYRN
ncbi:MAG: extracellular solute-binding protein [Candidatus Izemoplasmatales bacterium]